MKKYAASIILGTLLLASGARAAGDIVFVDATEVFKRFYKTQMAQIQIRQQADDIKLEREAMEADLNRLKEEVETLRSEARDTALSEDARQGRRDKLEELLVELNKGEQEMIEFEKLRIQQLEQQNTRMTNKLFDEIQEAIILYAKEQGYAGVIDRSAQNRAGRPSVLYADPKRDITLEIVAILNEGHEDAMADEPRNGAE